MIWESLWYAQDCPEPVLSEPDYLESEDEELSSTVDLSAVVQVTSTSCHYFSHDGDICEVLEYEDFTLSIPTEESLDGIGLSEFVEQTDDYTEDQYYTDLLIDNEVPIVTTTFDDIDDSDYFTDQAYQDCLIENDAFYISLLPDEDAEIFETEDQYFYEYGLIDEPPASLDATNVSDEEYSLEDQEDEESSSTTDISPSIAPTTVPFYPVGLLSSTAIFGQGGVIRWDSSG